ncbi:MFS transporter [Halanaerobaculum tunisiense]
MTFFVFDALLFFFQTVAKKVYTPLVTPLQDSLQISSTQAGLLITLVMLGYALARFPSGILTDIIGCQKTIISSGFLMAISLVIVGLAPNYFLLALLTFVMGLATGLYVTAGYSFAIDISTANKETTFTALIELFGGVGALVTPLTVVLFVKNWQIGWRPLFYSLGAGVLFVNLLFMYFSEEDNDVVDKELDYNLFKEEVKETVKVFQQTELAKFIIWATLVGGCGFFAITGFRSFIPSLLMEKGYSFSQANQLFTIIAIVGLLTKTGVAWLADKFGVKRVLVAILSLNFVFYFLFTSQISHWLVISSLVVFGVTFSSHNTLINSYVLKLFPDQYQGTGFGLFSTLYTVIYSLGPIVAGFFADKFSLVVGMRVSGIGILIAAPLLLAFNKLLDKELLGKNKTNKAA